MKRAVNTSTTAIFFSWRHACSVDHEHRRATSVANAILAGGVIGRRTAVTPGSDITIVRWSRSCRRYAALGAFSPATGGCAALHPRLFTGDRYAVGNAASGTLFTGNRYAVESTASGTLFTGDRYAVGNGRVFGLERHLTALGASVMVYRIRNRPQTRLARSILAFGGIGCCLPRSGTR